MGLYPMECSVCKKAFMWFSGSMDQRCAECQNTTPVKIKNKKLTKAELEAKLLELEKKILELQNRPVCYGHYCSCHCNKPVEPYWGYPNIQYTSGTGIPPNSIVYKKD